MRPIALMAAMQEEIDALLSSMTGVRSERIGERQFYAGELWGSPVVAVWSRWGKVASATTATQLLSRYDPAELVFIGLAGAVDPDRGIGDVIVADELVQHDMDARPLFPRHELPFLGVTRIPTDPVLTEELQRSAEHYLRHQLLTELPEEVRHRLGVANPVVTRGLMLSGDQFVADGKLREDLRRRLPDAICVEMEGAAVAQVAYEHGARFGIARIISDTADSHAAVDFQSFLTHIADPYSLGIIRGFLTAKARQL
ncbi:MAG: 5'-methylthioadenosine/adenosylhomocysteine nucleosidase [Candidatus Nanopelagicales bacterium]|nr:5'-methylthioadenosine/adenosylhomocysteine nucleosidase [Candidatus Nanopelagicales bacterium]MDZ4249223.1 5'-methylthioadenosine/adenosylhomocysteine nucleosidase [Candidatus Nanopelagicales bacterium]